MDGYEFVQLIETELKKRGMTKEEFYTGSGISSATFSQWRKRIYSPSSLAIRKIEDFLGISFAIEQKNNPSPDGNGLTPVQKEAWEIVSQMSDEQLEQFIRIAKAVLNI